MTSRINLSRLVISAAVWMGFSSAVHATPSDTFVDNLWVSNTATFYSSQEIMEGDSNRSTVGSVVFHYGTTNYFLRPDGGTNSVFIGTDGQLQVWSGNTLAMSVGTNGGVCFGTGDVVVSNNMVVSGFIYGTATNATHAESAANWEGSNLLGSAAYSNAGGFATSSQGSRADTAVQSSNVGTNLLQQLPVLVEDFEDGWLGLSWATYTNYVVYNPSNGWSVYRARIGISSTTNTSPNNCYINQSSNYLGWVQSPLLTNGVASISFWARASLGGTNPPMNLAIERSFDGGVTWAEAVSYAISTNTLNPYTNTFSLSDPATMSNQYLRIRATSTNSYSWQIDTIVVKQVTRTIQDIATIALSALQPNGSGSALTGITASQVGGISTSGVTSIIYSNPASFLQPTGNGSNLTGITALQVGGISTSGVTSIIYSNPASFLAPAGDGSNLTGITAVQVGAVPAVGGLASNVTFSGSVTFSTNAVIVMFPQGDLVMGSFTNGPAQ